MILANVYFVKYLIKGECFNRKGMVSKRARLHLDASVVNFMKYL